MTDITKCTGEGCPLKEKCYRYLAKSSEHYQSYFQKPPFKNYKTDAKIVTECEYYWKVDNNEK